MAVGNYEVTGSDFDPKADNFRSDLMPEPAFLSDHSEPPAPEALKPTEPNSAKSPHSSCSIKVISWMIIPGLTLVYLVSDSSISECPIVS